MVIDGFKSRVFGIAIALAPPATVYLNSGTVGGANLIQVNIFDISVKMLFYKINKFL